MKIKIKRSLEIPEEYMKDFILGKIDISKVVVRNKENGKIIKHVELKPIDKTNKIVENVGAKNLLLGVGITAAIVTIGGILNLVVKKKSQKENVEIPECVNRFHKSFRKYLKEAQKGILKQDTIEELSNSLDEIEKIDNKEIKIDFSAKETKFLLNRIYLFTQDINRENKITENKLKAPTNNSSKNIVYLKDYLEVQKQMTKKVAKF